jgi:hypothetical protein
LLLFSDAVLVWLVVIATTSIMVLLLLLLLLWWRLLLLLLLLLLRWRLRRLWLPFCIVDQGNQQQRHVQLHMF